MPSESGAGLALITPDWPAPPGVGSLMSTRSSGEGEVAGSGRGLNVGAFVGDDPAAVRENRRRISAAAGVPLVWLRQVHGNDVVRVGRCDAEGHPEPLTADAAWTDEPGVACAVQVADCLPVLFTTRDGRAVAAAHAGWRGLAAGVLERTLAALGEGAGAEAGEVLAWLGPCIGPRRFEVGLDVLQAFGASAREPGPWFVARPRPDGSPRWLADLQALARSRLAAAGVVQVSTLPECTVEAAARFHSFRRDGAASGRMVAAVWRQAGGRG